MGSKAKPRQKMSVLEFVQHKRRETCPVCRLPVEIFADIRVAREKQIKRATVLEWLQKVHGIKLSSSALDGHYSGRHENHDA